MLRRVRRLLQRRVLVRMERLLRTEKRMGERRARKTMQRTEKRMEKRPTAV
jgi:hypothetical protein